ncbi:MAG: hypothetical protein P8101_17500, partial [Candidatus Thiodiazotropha sp.]
LCVVGYYFLVLRNPLPSDEEMIRTFQEHRSDIEELVRRYQVVSPDPKIDHSTAWYKDPDTRKLMKRVGLDSISFSSYGPWLPSPYSIETAKYTMELSRNAKDYDLFIKRGGLIVKLLPRLHFRSYNLKYFHIWKDFYFIPEIPRIENGKLLWPVDENGKYTVRRRVLSSLDDFPDNWKAYECVYKQIEPHWFLSMCNGH